MKKIIGIDFPHYPHFPNPDKTCLNGKVDINKTGYSFSNLMYVLPQGDNVYYLHQLNELNDINDNEVEFYVISLHAIHEVPNMFINWAKNIPQEKIIVGGQYPSINYQDNYAMDLIKPYCYKIIIGNCDNLFATIEQEGQIVQGIENYCNPPRFDLFDVKKVDDENFYRFVLGIPFSTGCKFKCDFCVGSRLDLGKVKSKPLDVIQRDFKLLSDYTDKQEGIHNKKFFVSHDADFLSAKHWAEATEMVFSKYDIAHFMIAAGNLDSDKIKFLSNYNVSLSLALEILTIDYPKNKNYEHFKQMVEELSKTEIFFQIAYIINPDDILNYGKKYVEKLYFDSIRELNPPKIRMNTLCATTMTPIGKQLEKSGYKVKPYGFIEFPEILTTAAKDIIKRGFELSESLQKK